LKPEFMLAGAVLGIAGLLLRYGQGLRVKLGEYGLLLAGLVLPTLVFSLWFARRESWPLAFVDSSQAWWLVLVKQRTAEMLRVQPAFLGLDNPWANVRLEAMAALDAVAVLGAIWAAGWLVNRPWPWILRLVAVLGAIWVAGWIVNGSWLWVLRLVVELVAALEAGELASVVRLDEGWFHVGRCFPGLVWWRLIWGGSGEAPFCPSDRSWRCCWCCWGEQ
jgi:hypothetical protein